MTTTATIHAATTRRIARILRTYLGKQADIFQQDPIQLKDGGEIIPDLAVVKSHPQDYAERHPLAREVFLVIEVAVDSLDRDCDRQAQVYASAGIRDYWVVDAYGRKIHRFSEPRTDAYSSEIIFTQGTTIYPLKFPTVEIFINKMFLPLN